MQKDIIRSAPAFDLAVIAASLGGINALTNLLSTIPAHFPIPILAVQHRSINRPWLLAEILSRTTKLRIEEAKEGGPLQSGTVYLAPPGQHLLVNANNQTSLSDEDRVNFVRPSADLLFKSAARQFRSRLIGVILTGKGKDGSAGVQAIKEAGGVVITQDRASSLAFDMPRAAILTRDVDFVLPLDHIAAALMTLVMLRGAAKVFEVTKFPTMYLAMT